MHRRNGELCQSGGPRGMNDALSRISSRVSNISELLIALPAFLVAKSLCGTDVVKWAHLSFGSKCRILLTCATLDVAGNVVVVVSFITFLFFKPCLLSSLCLYPSFVIHPPFNSLLMYVFPIRESCCVLTLFAQPRYLQRTGSPLDFSLIWQYESGSSMIIAKVGAIYNIEWVSRILELSRHNEKGKSILSTVTLAITRIWVSLPSCSSP